MPEARGHTTMEDVAERAGVSRALVSLVMRGSPKVSDERRQRVLAAADELGYRPNAFARSLASRQSRTLTVLLNDLHNPFFAEIYDGVAEAAQRLGFRLLLGTGSRRENDEQRIVDAFLEYRPDGMVLLSPRLRPSTLASLTSLTRLVVVGRTAKGIDSVMTDESTGAHLVVQHLFDLGHRAIAHIDGGAGAGAAPRRAAYVRAMKRVGLADHVHVVPGDFTEEAGAEGVRALLVDRHSLPSAIFAANDLAAAGAMDALDDAGMRVPDDVSVVGYDNTFLANLHYVSLTTVHQARYEMGQEAVRLLVERIEGTRTDVQHVLAEPTLVVRSTTGRVASRAL